MHAGDDGGHQHDKIFALGYRWIVLVGPAYRQYFQRELRLVRGRHPAGAVLKLRRSDFGYSDRCRVLHV